MKKLTKADRKRVSFAKALFEKAVSNGRAENHVVFDRAVNSMSILDDRARGGDVEAAELYRALIETAVRHWAAGLPLGSKGADNSWLIGKPAAMGQRELALLWALEASKQFKDGEKRFRESTKDNEFKRYADNWVAVFWRWVDSMTPDGLRAKLMEQSRNYPAASPESFADVYLLKRFEYFSVTRRHQRFFNADFIRKHLPFVALAESLGDGEVLNELDRPRHVKAEPSRRKRLPTADVTKYWMLFTWLSCALWREPVWKRPQALGHLITELRGEETDFTKGQLHHARKSLKLIAEKRFGRRIGAS